MSKITKIEPQKKRHRFNIFVDDKFAVGVFEEVIIALGLKENEEIDLRKIKKLEKTEEEIRAYNNALRLLSYRQRSEKEMAGRLKRKFPEKLVRKTVSRLKKEKLLNEAEFARAWVRSRMTLRPKGKRLIFYELRCKGIPEELIKKTLKKEYNENKELELARKLTQKKKQSLKNLLPRERRQKLIGFLQRRGFSWDTIKVVIKN
ncbi:MAG: RecX family transcriptional regulator [Candidatus Berkelbacteria bacterium]|nr:RecX family transcriptional regulator [Candidatus Berkelbacteria bacterium]